MKRKCYGGNGLRAVKEETIGTEERAALAFWDVEAMQKRKRPMTLLSTRLASKLLSVESITPKSSRL